MKQDNGQKQKLLEKMHEANQKRVKLTGQWTSILFISILVQSRW